MNNMVLFEIGGAIAEALAIGRQSGVEPAVLLEALPQRLGRQLCAAQPRPKAPCCRKSYPERAFSTRYALKDLEYALALAAQAGIDAPGARLARERFLESHRRRRRRALLARDRRAHRAESSGVSACEPLSHGQGGNGQTHSRRLKIARCPVRTKNVALALAGSILAVAAARAEMDVGSWLAQDTATGDWGGLRSRAEAAGVTFEGNYQTDLLTNPIGGEKHGFAYAGLLEASLAFDLETIMGLKGLEFFIAASWASGRDLSDKDIGNLIAVSQVFSGRSVRLDQMYFQQTLLDEALNLAVVA